jgi:hypothetical protein
MRTKMKLIWIETTRHSSVVKEFALKFPEAKARLDGQLQVAPLEEWCTNKRLREAINFSLNKEDEDIMGFHDDPRNMWASENTLLFIEELKAQGLLRYSLVENQPRHGIFKRVLKWIMHT